MSLMITGIMVPQSRPRGTERTVLLRKLLEAKDASVRAVAIPESRSLKPGDDSGGRGFS